jgi:hypothetical protein
VEFDLAQDSPGFLTRKTVVQRASGVRGKVIENHPDFLRIAIVSIGQIPHALGKVPPGTMIRDLHMPPGLMNVNHDK